MFCNYLLTLFCWYLRTSWARAWKVQVWWRGVAMSTDLSTSTSTGRWKLYLQAVVQVVQVVQEVQVVQVVQVVQEVREV